METPLRIEVEGSSHLVLTWGDGTTQEVAASRLRAACPCAACNDSAGAEQIRLLVGGPVPIAIDSASLVGDYGLNLTFSPDGHHTGIFSFDLLHSL